MTTSIYPAIEAIAKQVTRHYMTDITVHDKALCAALQTDNVALWCAREFGSHWVWIIAPTDCADPNMQASLRKRLECFDATNTVWPDCRWHVILSTEGTSGHVEACTTDAARARLLDHLRAVEQKARPQPLPA